MHITNGINMNHERHKGNHDHHTGSQIINEKSYMKRKGSNIYPAI